MKLCFSLFLLSFMIQAEAKLLEKEILGNGSLEKTISLDKEHTVIHIKRINLKKSQNSDPGFFLNLAVFKYCESKNLGFETFGGSGSEIDASSSFKCEGKVDRAMWEELMSGMCENHIESENIQNTCSELNHDWETL